MDDGRYYRYAAFLPLGLTAAGLIAASATPISPPNRFLHAVHDVGMYLTFIGFYALVPYGIFMAIVWRFFRPEGLAAHRRLAILAPLLIAIGLSVAGALYLLSEAGLAGLTIGFWFFGGYALAVGYFHAALVIAVAECSAAIARRRGRRTHRASLTAITP